MARTLVPCAACSELVFQGSCTCPHCGARHPCASRAASRAAILLGLALAGCGAHSHDSSGGDDTSTGDDGSGSTIESQGDYSGGITDSDVDGDNDGYASTDRGGDDCDDDNPDIHPGATETPGDDVDSNCDGADDT